MPTLRVVPFIATIVWFAITVMHAAAGDWEDCRRMGGKRGLEACARILAQPGLTKLQRAEVLEARADLWFGQFGLVLAFGGNDNKRAAPFLDRAIEDYTEVIRLKPADASAYRRRADFLHLRAGRYNRKKDYAAAIADCSSAIALDPKDSDYQQRGGLYAIVGDDQRAVADFGQAIKMNPTDGGHFLARASLLGKRGEIEGALGDYTTAIQLKPAEPAPYKERALLYLQFQRHDLAVADYGQFIRLKPDDPDGYIGRAKALSYSNKLGEAIRDLDEAIRLAPTSAAAYNNRAWYLWKQGHPEKALLDADKARSLAPSWTGSLDARGHILLGLGRIDAAIGDFNSAIEQGKKLAGTYYGRGKAYQLKNRPDLAVVDYRRAIQIEPNGPDEREFKARAQDAIARLAAVPTPPVPVPARRRRIALVIGNAKYVHAAHLNNPINDATAVAESLRRVSFAEVVVRYDQTAEEMVREFKALGDRAIGADWAVVYFAGHGIQLDGNSYLIPTDAKLQRAHHILDEAISLDSVLAKVAEAKTLRLVILDACRANPFLERLTRAGGPRSFGNGLARPATSAGGLLVAYAARDGQLAADGVGKHSPFTEALLEQVERPGVEIGLLFRRVRDTVLQRTAGAQEPFTYGAISGAELYFRAATK